MFKIFSGNLSKIKCGIVIYSFLIYYNSTKCYFIKTNCINILIIKN